jgi:hypothetical protein
MTLAGIRQAVRDLIDSPNNDSFLSDVLLNRMINNSYKKLVVKIQKKFASYYMKQSTITLVANTYLYDLPSDAVAVSDIYNADGESLLSGNKREFSVVDNTGSPVYYDFFGNHVWLDPVPDSVGTLNINYTYIPADMGSNNETPDFPIADCAQLVAIDVAMQTKVRDEASVSALRIMYNDLEQSILSLLLIRNLRETRRVRGGLSNFGATDI